VFFSGFKRCFLPDFPAFSVLIFVSASVNFRYSPICMVGFTKKAETDSEIPILRRTPPMMF